jgi:signal transduction histidine kinase
MMAAGPAVAAFILTVITFALVPRVSIGGPSYRQLMWGKDFEVASVAPSLYIIEIHTEIQQLVMQGTAGHPTGGLESDIARHQAQYESDYNNWVNRLTDPKTKNELTASHEAAAEYFRLYEQRLLPALRTGRTAEANQLLTSQMAKALTEHRAATQSAAHRVQKEVESQEKTVTAQSDQQALGMIAIALLIAAASTALGFTILRSITERVQRLNEVATVELPQVLDEVKRAALAGEEIPTLPTPRSEGSDELAAATVAFNSVVATAVGLAADQSRVRRSTSQMFINLGRRNHKLLSRTLTYITQLESDERDPGTLQNLFRLDHLTTRMRRHAESLLVLAGSPPLRTWSRPVPIADVLRAALSEIETYDRVDIKELEPVEVRGASVSDLAHLLAELLENATAFSPPQTRVRVLGRIDSDGYTVVVVDEGIGMSSAELESANQLINSPNESGFLSDSRMLGLGVVGRLAARHGFRVNLTASPVGGVVAWVTLPTSALAPRRGGADPEPSSGGLTVAGFLGAADALPRQQAITTTERDETQAEATEPANGRPTPGPIAPSTLSLPSGDGGEPGLTDQPVGSGTATPQDQYKPPAEALPAGFTAPVDASVDAMAPADRATADLPTTEDVTLDDGTTAAVEPASPATERTTPGTGTPAAPTPAGVTGSFPLPPRAPEVASPPTGSVIIPQAPDVAPVSGPIAFRKPPTGPGEPTSLTRRVRGAQLPDTGETTPAAPSARPERSAQSVRGALQSFNAGRRTASEITFGHTKPITEPIITGGSIGRPAASTPAAKPAPTTAARTGRSTHDATAEPLALPGERPLPRRVKGAQMPETDVPTSAPPPERTAADVRAALSNFVAGRRAAEHED